MDAAEVAGRAHSLLRTYTSAFCPQGAEIEELRCESVSEATIASLYPYRYEEWRGGYERLVHAIEYRAELATTQRLKEISRRLHPQVLTQRNWNTARILTQSIIASPPHLPAEAVEHYNATRSLGPTGGPVGAAWHLHVIVMLLHLLATSPHAAQALRHEPLLRCVSELLDDAQTLTRDSAFPKARAHR